MEGGPRLEGLGPRDVPLLLRLLGLLFLLTDTDRFGGLGLRDIDRLVGLGLRDIDRRTGLVLRDIERRVGLGLRDMDRRTGLVLRETDLLDCVGLVVRDGVAGTSISTPRMSYIFLLVDLNDETAIFAAASFPYHTWEELSNSKKR